MDEVLHNLTQPKWMAEFFPEVNMTAYEAMIDVATQTQDEKYHSPIKAKFLSGFAFGTWLSNLQRAITGTFNETSSTKLDVYAVHQGAIKSMLHLLNNGCIFVELYRVGQNDFYVETYYRDLPDSEPTPLHLNGCNPNCTFDDFANLYRNMTYSSENELEIACGLHSAETPPPTSSITTLSATMTMTASATMTAFRCINLIVFALLLCGLYDF